MRITVSKPFRTGFRSCLLAALVAIGCGCLATLQAGERISAYVDSHGKVIFVNEAPPEPSTEPTTPSSKTTASPNHSKPSGSSEQEAAAEPSAASGTAVQPSLTQSAWDGVIESTANRHQVDPDLVRAMVRVESNFNPYAVSSRGAKGLMQLIPGTAQRFGVRNSFDPRSNVDGGVRYLKYLMNMFGGDLKLSLAAYNAGEKAVDRYNGVPPYPETRDYLRRITQIYPLPSLKQGPAAAVAAIIEKYVDSKGIVHFSNTALP